MHVGMQVSMHICSRHYILPNYTPDLHRYKQNVMDYSCAIKLQKILHTTMWFKATFIGEPSNMWTRWSCSKSVNMELLYIKVCDKKKAAVLLFYFVLCINVERRKVESGQQLFDD